MNLTVLAGRPLKGQLTLPGDKSISHRAALFAAVADGDCHIHNFLFAGVTEVMLKALAALGVIFERDGTTLIVHGKGFSGLHVPNHPIDCGNSATTLRLLAGLLAAAGIPAILDGTESLRHRPMGRIVTPLKVIGVPISASQSGGAPVVIGSRPSHHRLKAIDYSMPVASAQVKSTLLIASLAADGVCSIQEPGPSRDHTEVMLRGFGISVKTAQSSSEGQKMIHKVSLGLDYPPRIPAFEMAIPGDISSGAFLIAGALIAPGSQVQIEGMGLNPTRTGLLDAFCNMGAEIGINQKEVRYGEASGEITVGHQDLHSTAISGSMVVRMIDEFPAFTSVAATAQGETSVTDAQELRTKESDRISSLAQEFRNIGVEIDERSDGYSLSGPVSFKGGTVDPHHDHRLAMALAICGLAAEHPVTVKNAGIISESYPDFIKDLQTLGASVRISDDS